MVSEQFALDSEDAVSLFPAGSYNVDFGATLRTELRWPAFAFSRYWAVSPYMFTAGGTGHVYNSTAAEAADMRIGALGLGGRITAGSLPLLGTAKVTIGVEYGRQFVNLVNQAAGNRLNLQMAIGF
jgi:hemolysin activation/secretion protein